VGRSALDESAIRSIEDSNPDVEFDWTRILEDQSGPEGMSPPPRAGVERAAPRRPAEPQGPRGAAPGSAGTPPPRLAPPVRARPQPPVARAAPPAAEAQFDRADARDDGIPQTPAHARLGAEGLLRLRTRHAEILARISERVEEPARQDELKVQAERLNPDTWVTDEDVQVGVEDYETVLSALRSVVGQARRPPRARTLGLRSSAGAEIPAHAAADDPETTRQGFRADAERAPQPDEEPV